MILPNVRGNYGGGGKKHQGVELINSVENHGQPDHREAYKVWEGCATEVDVRKKNAGKWGNFS